MANMKDIELEKIVIGPSQSRVRRLDEDIDKLVNSIEKLGLLEPVVVYENQEGKYELLTGQRRLLAVQQLGWDKIPAQIVDPPRDAAHAKAISLTENFVRKDLTRADLIDACHELWHRYNNWNIIAEETGLDPKDVRKYVKYAGLIDPLKKLCDDNVVDQVVADRAQEAATAPDGTIDQEKAVKYALSLKKMGSDQRRQLQKITEADATKPADQVVAEALQPPSKETLRITLLRSEADSLGKFADDSKTTKEEAALELLLVGLKSAGYPS